MANVNQFSTTRSGWPNKEDEYELGKVIGAGATAVVHAAYCKPRKEKCSIKRINLENCNENIDGFLKEIQAMNSCNHSNVVKYHTSFIVKEEIWIVMKLLGGGSLLDIIKYKMKTEDCSNGVFDKVTIATVLKETLKGLQYFHNNGQIHRDIKAGNILIADDGTVQIADFGVSSWLAVGRDLCNQKSRHTLVGTPCWMAPEVVEQEVGYNFKADIWSFGITAIELATGTAPYFKYPPMKVLMLILKNDPPTLASVSDDNGQHLMIGKSIRKMISCCLKKDPAKRPTATELLKHPFFKKAKDKKFLVETLLTCAPSIEIRAQKFKSRQMKRPSDSDEQLQNSKDVDWEWSSDSETDPSDTKNQSNRQQSRLESKNESTVIVQNQKTSQVLDCCSKPYTEPIKAVSPTIPKQDDPQNMPSICAQPKTSNGMPVVKDDDLFTFSLRLMNQQRKLTDITFVFNPKKDTSFEIAKELMYAGFVGVSDVNSVTVNLKKLLENENLKIITFAVNHGLKHGDIPNIKTFIGYAQLSRKK